MINYLKAELYRIINKKSMYIYLSSMFLIYLMTIFVRSNTDYTSLLITDIQVFCSILPFFVGTYLFSVVFHDDLQAKTLPTIIGFGRSKTFIVVAKLILGITFLIFVYLLIFSVVFLLYKMLGVPLEGGMALKPFALIVQPLLLTISYFTITSIVTYGFQKTTFSIVTYTLLSVGLINNLLSMVLSMGPIKNIIGDLNPYTLSSIVNKITESLMGNHNLGSSLLLYLSYITITIFFTIFAFKKSELDFS